MGLFDWLLPGKARPSEDPDQEAGIERLVQAIDPRLKALSGTAARLGPSVTRAMDGVVLTRASSAVSPAQATSPVTDRSGAEKPGPKRRTTGAASPVARLRAAIQAMEAGESPSPLMSVRENRPPPTARGATRQPEASRKTRS